MIYSEIVKMDEDKQKEYDAANDAKNNAQQN